MDATETDDPSVIGEECHIVAQSSDGPRGQSELTAQQREKYANLILLCGVDHKIIDDQPATFTVTKVLAIKTEYEKWVRDQLGFDNQKQIDDEIYATYVEEWATRLKIDDWRRWASWLISHGQPSISDEMKQSLEEIRPWLLSRIWPGRYPQLESAFLNFRRVSQDLCNVFGKYAVKRGDNFWQTKKFYQIEEWNPDLYKRLSDEFDDHVGLVEDLALELTRAANYVCDNVRKVLLSSYRIREGALLIDGGPYMDMSFKTYRVEYSGAERTDLPYPGLETFRTVRFDRDLSFGDPDKD